MLGMYSTSNLLLCTLAFVGAVNLFSNIIMHVYQAHATYKTQLQSFSGNKNRMEYLESTSVMSQQEIDSLFYPLAKLYYYIHTGTERR